MRKGFNQIDLVFALVTVIVIITLSFHYSSNYIKPFISSSDSMELKYISKGLSDTVFMDTGIPSDWNWREDLVKPGLGCEIYRVPVYLSEWNGTDNNGVPVFIYLEPDENAYNSSIIVYDGNTTLNTDLDDILDSDGDGFLEGVNVSFEVDVQAYDEKIIYIYYSKDNGTEVQYSSLSEKNNTLNITMIDPQMVVGIFESKMNSLERFSNSDFRRMFGIDFPFRIQVIFGDDVWSYGYNDTGKDTGINRRSIVYQNSTGHIESVEAFTYVWK